MPRRINSIGWFASGARRIADGDRALSVESDLVDHVVGAEDLEPGERVVAEGIQTEAQHQIVRDLGCQGAQGFYFGRPASEPLRALND